jgi:hypothetical protein
LLSATLLNEDTAAARNICVAAMKILSRRIRRRLEIQTRRLGHCAIYERELQRVWPLNEENRKAKIAQFAKEYGFHLSFYKQGLCAIFEKEPAVAA